MIGSARRQVDRQPALIQTSVRSRRLVDRLVAQHEQRWRLEVADHDVVIRLCREHGVSLAVVYEHLDVDPTASPRPRTPDWDRGLLLVASEIAAIWRQSIGSATDWIREALVLHETMPLLERAVRRGIVKPYVARQVARAAAAARLTAQELAQVDARLDLRHVAGVGVARAIEITKGLAASVNPQTAAHIEAETLRSLEGVRFRDARDGTRIMVAELPAVESRWVESSLRAIADQIADQYPETESRRSVLGHALTRSLRSLPAMAAVLADAHQGDLGAALWDADALDAAATLVLHTGRPVTEAESDCLSEPPIHWSDDWTVADEPADSCRLHPGWASDPSIAAWARPRELLHPATGEVLLLDPHPGPPLLREVDEPEAVPDIDDEDPESPEVLIDAGPEPAVARSRGWRRLRPVDGRLLWQQSTDPIEMATEADPIPPWLWADREPPDAEHASADVGAETDLRTVPLLSGPVLTTERRSVRYTSLLPRAVIHVHVSAHSALSGIGIARVEQVGPLTVAGLGRHLADCRITVAPVIDLNQPIAVDQYEIPDPIRRAVTQRDTHSRFPWSVTPASACDLDHTVPWSASEPSGQTATDNLAPLARREHRTKSYGHWRPTTATAGTITWTSPHGLTYATGPFGTLPGGAVRPLRRAGRLIPRRGA
jgi:hypothetical protein